MTEKKPFENSSAMQKVADGDPRFRVYGLNIVAKIIPEAPRDKQIYCPKGQPIKYGTVLSCGDGFDPQANAFRDLPSIGSIVAFEETIEGVEGHYFFIGEDEFRILHLDVVNIAFPPEDSPR